MNYQAVISEEKEQKTLSIRTTGSMGNLPQLIGSAYGEIMQYMSESGQAPAGAPFVAYYNMDMDNLDIEIGFPVAQQLAGKGRVQPSQIPGGKQLSCIHIGPYNSLEPAYQALMQQVEKNGLAATGVAYEFYLNDPAQTPQEKLMTKVVFPLVNQ